jgi:hypothetical protein
LDRTLSLSPADPLAHYYRGRAYAARTDDDQALRQAVAAYIKVTQLDAGFAEAYRELAVTYSKLGEVDRAGEARQRYVALREAVASSPIPGRWGLGNGPGPLARSRSAESRPD